MMPVFETVHSLLMQYSVFAVHGQAHLTDEDLRNFGLLWGNLDVHGYSPTVEGFDDMLNIRSGPKGRCKRGRMALRRQLEGHST